MQYILAIDQGTTNSRAFVFDHEGVIKAQYQQECQLYYPQDGWVEQNPEAIWQSTFYCCQQAIARANLSATEITALGISNQRETTVIWERATGKAIYPAIVWQDRRTAENCKQLSTQAGIAEMVKHKTGLLLDPYFSASKISWILDHVASARERAIAGELIFGTIDSYLLWWLTAGRSHYTDASNASRTLLFNIRTQNWDDELLHLFNIPKKLLPKVLDNAAEFGKTDKKLFNYEIPITGMAGDQQAATIGQACFHSGMIKSTYGTGCFMVLNTGNKIVVSNNKLLSTVAYRLKNQVTYALEGSIFIAGAAVQWLRDGLHLIKKSSETEEIAASVTDTGGVYLVPAFTGLGAPYWHPQARGALLGLTRNTSAAHIVRATLEAVAYQSRDLLQAILADYAKEISVLRVDGGMAVSNWLLQFLADILNIRIQRPQCVEAGALGTAFLAGLGAGIYQSLNEISTIWKIQQEFIPQMHEQQRQRLYEGWQEAVKRII